MDREMPCTHGQPAKPADGEHKVNVRGLPGAPLGAQNRALLTQGVWRGALVLLSRGVSLFALNS